MLGTILFFIGLVIATGIGLLYFRDLGDITQMLLKVKRENMLRFIRNEYRLLAIAGGGLLLMTVAHFGLAGGPRWLWWTAILLNAVLLGFPWVWVHVGLRNQKDRAQYFPVEKAWEWVSPSTQVVVMENGGAARAHPDAQIMRPHLAGNSEGLGGEDVVMTYCAVANLGLGYKPEVEGKKLDLEVMAQHGNNLILRDNATSEPVQQIRGIREGDSAGMAHWPTFRMTARGFAKAYPQGEVFINVPPKNPLLWIFDKVIDTIFASEIGRQHREAAPIMDNMTRYDDRLHNKTYIWGIEIGGDAVCWTDDFVVAQGNIVNATVGGTAVVVAWDPIYESLGVYYNTTGAPVQSIDFFGKTDNGTTLPRVESLRPGMFWHVWAEFFPETDINRVGEKTSAQAA